MTDYEIAMLRLECMKMAIEASKTNPTLVNGVAVYADVFAEEIFDFVLKYYREKDQMND